MTTRAHSGAVDSHGNVYVIQELDARSTSQIKKMDDRGNVLNTFTLTLKGGTTSVNTVKGIDVDNKDHIWIGVTLAGGTTGAAANTAVLMQLDGDGNVLQQVDVGAEWPNNNLGNIKYDPRGYVWVFGSGSTTADIAHCYDDRGNKLIDFGTSFA